MSFTAGNIVKCRGREWIVLPDSTGDLLLLKPLGGTDDEITGVCTPLEKVESATFDWPDPSKPGDWQSCRLLRDAVRLSLRAAAGPFRSFGRIAVEPRPYQLVPLLMALKLDPVRLLIADDVGIGKTVEACLIARELLDRGEITRLAVLCPPHLAEQWQAELRDKFHIDAELVLAGTARRLENDLGPGETLFDRHPFVIVSLEYIKARSRKDDFVRSCPEFIIVDEAHACAYGEDTGRQMRHELIKAISAKPGQHLVLVTATPHSGKDNAFQSLLGLLQSEFGSLPTDLSGTANEPTRKLLARHLVQRRRDNIRSFMKDTAFPKRFAAEQQYGLSPEYRTLFSDVLKYTREQVAERAGDTKFRQRVRWWSALGLLHALASSPAAAALSLASRAQSASAATPEEADVIGQRTVMDLMDASSDQAEDGNPGADPTLEDEPADRRRLQAFADRAEKLRGDADPKLQEIIKPLKRLLAEKYNPILFCRFIETAEYLAVELRQRLGSKVEIAAITGNIPPAEREGRVKALAAAPQRILVCTDCLSEGMNLQPYFDAVIHYDLAWNPTRHEQREGRVDRFGQPSPEIRVLTYYGQNLIDGLVLEVLLRKHERIRSSLGISIPMPVNSEAVLQNIMDGLMLRQDVTSFDQLAFDFYRPQKAALDGLWDRAAESENRARTVFAQESLKPEEVMPEWESVRKSIGGPEDVRRFFTEALTTQGAVAVSKGDAVQFALGDCPRDLLNALDLDGEPFSALFEPPAREHSLWISRSHPLLDRLATHLLDTASDPLQKSVASRCGVIRTSRVEQRTTLLLLRFRYHIIATRTTGEKRTLAEECLTVGYRGSPSSPVWLGEEEVRQLLDAKPESNTTPDLASHDLAAAITRTRAIIPELEHIANRRADELLAAHRRVRTASRGAGVRHEVEPVLPVDVMGLYLYLPLAQPLA